MGEYAKWLWYQNATDIVQNRLYLFTEKVHRLKIWERDGVEYAVCNAPFFIGKNFRLHMPIFLFLEVGKEL